MVCLLQFFKWWNSTTPILHLLCFTKYACFCFFDYQNTICIYIFFIIATGNFLLIKTTQAFLVELNENNSSSQAVRSYSFHAQCSCVTEWNMGICYFLIKFWCAGRFLNRIIYCIDVCFSSFCLRRGWTCVSPGYYGTKSSDLLDRAQGYSLPYQEEDCPIHVP